MNQQANNDKPKGEKNVHDSARQKWGLLRKGLKSGSFCPNDVDKAKKSKFISEFDRFFVADNGKYHFTKKLSTIFEQAYSVRGTIINDDEPEPTFDRFIPKAKYIKEDNRFSPKGVEWLYLALGFPKTEDGLSKAEMCAQKECRAESANKFAICHFDYANSDADVVDLTVGDDWSWNKQRYVFRNLINNGHTEHLEDSFQKGVVFAYAKIISDELFVKIDSTEKEIAYAPFHCFAYYFQSLGYKGIIYKSTVCLGGKNLVLFDKSLASPVGKIKYIK